MTAVPVTAASAPDEARPSTTRDGWRLMLRQVRTQKWGILAGVAVGLVWTAGKVSVPLLVQQGIDRGIRKDDPSSALRWALLIGVAGLVAAVFTGLRRYAAFREARITERTLRDRLFAHIQRLHFAFHDRTQTGQLMSRANTDLQQIFSVVVMIPLTISNAATAVAVTVILLLASPTLTLLALGALPLMNVLAKRFASRLAPAVAGIQEQAAQVATVVEESVAGVRVVKGFGAERLQVRKLDEQATTLNRVALQAAGVRATYLPAIDLLPNIGLIAVLGFGGHQVISGDLTIGQLVAFNAYVVLLIWPLRMLGMIISQGQQGAAAASRVHEVLATAPLIRDEPGAAPLAPGGGAVRFEHVDFAYGPADPLVLRGFDLTIEAGESVALVGATGSGKSTIAMLIARFYDVGAGRVLIDGCDVRRTQLHDVRRAVGFVFEETFLFTDTVGANIAFADVDATRADIERAARLAGAHDFIVELPDGYETVVGEHGYSLSGGQRQRIAIARAILADPRVLILDDATSAVDPSKEHEIRDALAEVMGNRTTVVIAHRPATIALADRVVLVGDGRVLAHGTHERLLATSAAYREVLAAVGHPGDDAPYAEGRVG